MEPHKKQRSLKWARHQKRWFGKWHLYLGLFAGVIVAFVGITGSILVFQDEIDRLLNPELFNITAAKQKLPVAEVVSIVKREHPKLVINYIDIKTTNPFEAYAAYNFKTEEEYFINPYNGELSGKRIHESSFIHIVTELHRTLLIPVAGRYIVGLASLCLLILTISGLRMWIPKKWNQLKSSLSVKFSGSFKRQNYDWHNVLGVYSSPVVSMLALTGFCITFSTIVIPFLFILNGKSPQGVAKLLGAKSIYHQGIPALPLDQILGIAKKTIPEGRVAGIAFPADSTGSYRLDILSPDVLKTGKREMLIVEQYTGKILLNSHTDFPNVGNAYLSWLTPLHYGSFGGRPTQILALIAGLMPLVLLITGFLIWWPRFKKQKRGIAPKTPRPLRLKEEDIPSTLTPYFIFHLKIGFRYAALILVMSTIMAGLYGLAAGIVLQPMVFAIAFSTILVIMNFIFAVLFMLLNLLFFIPFKKGKRNVLKYFALSLSFLLVYLVAYMLLLNTGLNIF
ncbi:PepSY domain-containing protein [Pedobacter sp. MC2016-14]|uniref:PepSY-associated TM helix domain-containing protein n=1 Tax=Pedobacter sp. MC2016-14 TaxID=2897327 RepID=UPI001E39E03A|nr:PepSY-associated TM helix domain-containing protein [Pedobacter sp. MC2016-14]MCD0488419.1 PepSY domain-containing protein [Pedobacter sp. MC2016-14]